MQREHERGARRRGRSDPRQSADDPFGYWRQLAPEDFDRRRRAKLAGSISRLGSIFPNWQAAMAGDASAAIGIVLRLRPPFHISGRVNLAMSLLLNCAFENASAALVLSYALTRMHLARITRIRLAVSWLSHHRRLARSGRNIGGAGAGRRKPRTSRDPARIDADCEGELQPVYDPSGGPDDAA